ncbi:hypothetical protein, partial [Klebsiella pneumoniae]|uniref:hypothetical protein n=1 Tax=Klebsiella pneumoniae TaxID=573 RepID=UPI0013D598C8
MGMVMTVTLAVLTLTVIVTRVIAACMIVTGVILRVTFFGFGGRFISQNRPALDCEHSHRNPHPGQRIVDDLLGT